jgi:hypothetical protein
MIRIVAKLFAVAVALAIFLYAAPLSAAPVGYVSSTGNDANPCTAAQPCATLFEASTVWGGQNGEIACLNFPSISEPDIQFIAGNVVTIDCAGVLSVTTTDIAALGLNGTGALKIRNLTINGQPGGYPAIKVIGSGSLILENCAFENFSGIALDIEPSGPFNLVITNSRISNNAAAGVLIKPAAGGSVTATFNGATIVNNAGGMRIDTTNGAVRADISNSTISNNANNGLIAIGGAGGTNMVTVKNDVIASNGQAGIEASGANAAVLVNNSVLDSNTTGATSAASGGRILTYGNNSTIGLAGTGFTGTAPLN